ncbi:MAG: DUF748 domain-containing protein [Paludibacteraceae bacterium]|nr:DUF748 domain-containing protein [Paludibacteraceae bacterium]
MPRFLKISLIILGVFLSIAIVGSIAGHITIATYLSNKLGRNVSASFVYANPLTGAVYIRNLRCTETDHSTPFISADALKARINTYALAARKVSLLSVTIDGLDVSVVSLDTCFNFSDIPTRFRSGKPKSDKAPWTVSLNNISLNRADVHYSDSLKGINWSFSDLSFSVPGLHFDARHKKAGVSLDLPDGGGSAAVGGSYDARTRQFTLTVAAENLSPESLLPVIKQHVNIDDVRAAVSADLKAYGSLDDIMAAHVSGTLGIAGLDVRDGWRHSVAKCQNMNISVKDISLKNMQIDVDNFKIDSLTLDLKNASDGSTWAKIFKAEPKTADTVSVDDAPAYNGKKISTDGLRLRIGNLSIANSSVAYENETLPSDFQYTISSITAQGKEIDTRSTSNHILLSGSLPEGGSFMLNWRGGLNPHKSACRAVVMLRNIKLNKLSPWTEHVFGYALKSGTLSISSDNTIINGKLDATERIDVLKPELGKKLRRGTPLVNVPLKLAIGLLKNPQGNIEMQVPVSGNLNSPEFKLSDVVGKAIGHVLLQATAAPFVVMAKARNRNDDLSKIEIDMLIPDFTLEQYQKLDLIAEMMNENDDIHLALTQYYNTNSAVQDKAVFDLKRDYYRANNPDAIGELTVVDIQKITSIRDNNADFQSWCKKNVSSKRGSLKERAMAHYGTSKLNAEVEEAAERRNKFVVRYLTEQRGIDNDRISVATAPADELHKYKGNPQYAVSAGTED